MEAEGVQRATYSPEGDLIQANPTLEIYAVRKWLDEHGFPPETIDHRMIAQDLIRNTGHLAEDFIGIWEQAISSGFPMTAPVALALGPVGGNPTNCSRVENRARFRLERKERLEAEEKRAREASDPLAAMVGHPKPFVRLLGQLVKLRQGGVIPQADMTRLTVGYPGSAGSQSQIDEIVRYLAAVKVGLSPSAPPALPSPG